MRCARVAAREGATLAICARGGEALEAVAEECRASGCEVIAVLADIADAARCRAIRGDRAGALRRASTCSSTTPRSSGHCRCRSSPMRRRARWSMCSGQCARTAATHTGGHRRDAASQPRAGHQHQHRRRADRIRGAGSLQRFQGGARRPDAELVGGAAAHQVRVISVDPGDMNTACTWPRTPRPIRRICSTRGCGRAAAHAPRGSRPGGRPHRSGSLA